MHRIIIETIVLKDHSRTGLSRVVFTTCDRPNLPAPIPTLVGRLIVSREENQQQNYGRTRPGCGGPTWRSMRMQLIPATPARSPKINEVVSQEMEAVPLPTMESG